MCDVHEMEHGAAAVSQTDRFDVYFGWLMSNDYTRMTWMNE